MSDGICIKVKIVKLPININQIKIPIIICASVGLKIAGFFGLFQALMPCLGWLVGLVIREIVANYAPWIASFVFFYLGAKTIKEYKRARECDPIKCNCTNYPCLVSFSLATSIDALIIGGVLALMEVSLFPAIIIIGLIFFLTCCN